MTLGKKDSDLAGGDPGTHTSTLQGWRWRNDGTLTLPSATDGLPGVGVGCSSWLITITVSSFAPKLYLS